MPTVTNERQSIEDTDGDGVLDFLAQGGLDFAGDKSAVFGPSDNYEIKWRDSDGTIVIEDTANGNNLVFDSNGNLVVPGGLTVDGTTTEVDDIITTQVEVDDVNGNNEFLLDGDDPTPFADFYGNQIRNINSIAGDGLLISGTNDDTLDINQGDGSGLDADSTDGYDIQKNGTDGEGIINFKTA